MKKNWIPAFAGMVILLVAAMAMAQIKLQVIDPSGQTQENILESLYCDGTSMTIHVKNPLPPKTQTIKIKIDGIDGSSEVTAIDLAISTSQAPAPVSPTPTPGPTSPPDPDLIRPVPPFPRGAIGPFPDDKSDLIQYCKPSYSGCTSWAKWLEAHPEDLDWAWSEYKKAYGF